MLVIMVGMTRGTLLRLHMAALSSTWHWHVHGWFCWFDAVRAVFTALVGRPAVESCMAALSENCGAPQLQFVDQVESSLFGNRDMYAQCNCAVFSCQGWCLLDS